MASSRLRFVSLTPTTRASITYVISARNYGCCIRISLGSAAATARRGPGRREFSLTMGGYEAHGLLAGARVSGVDAAHGACDGNAPRLLHAPHRHAQMFGLDDEDGAPGAQPLVDSVGDLGGKTLLELRAMGITLHKAGQLGQAYDLPVWYVAHVGLADHRQEVMLTERLQRYIPDQDHLTMLFLEPHVQVSGGVIGQPGEEERVGFGDPARRASEAFPFRVFAYGDQYLPDGAFDPRPVHPVL